MRRLVAILALATALIPSAYLAWHARDMPHLGYFQDDSLYLVGARSLAQGTGYRIQSLPGSPNQTKYPPLYAMALTLVWRIRPDFPRNLPLAALFAWLPLPFCVWVAWRLYASLGLAPWHRLLLCVLVAVNVHMAFFSTILMPELVFFSLAWAAVMVAERADQKTSGLALAAGLMAGAAYLAKSAGLPLLVSIPLGFALRRRYKPAAVFACGMLPAVAAWSLWTQVNRNPGNDPVTLAYTNYLASYLHEVSWSDLPLVLYKNVSVMLSGIGGLLVFGLEDSFWGLQLARLLGAGSLIGVVRLARRTGRWQAPLFTAGFLSLLVVWSYPPNERFLLPVYPLLLAGFSTELQHVAGLLGKGFRARDLASRVVAGAMAAALLVLFAFAAVVYYRGFRQVLPGIVTEYRTMREATRGAYQWVRENLPGDARLVTSDDAVLFLYTGRRACRMPISGIELYREEGLDIPGRLRRLAAFAREQGLGYYLETESEFRTLSQTQRRQVNQYFGDSREFVPLYSSPGATVYRIVAEK